MREEIGYAEKEIGRDRNRGYYFSGIFSIQNAINARPCLFWRLGFNGEIPFGPIKVICKEVRFIVHHERG
jgi:hypothetical protein